MNNSNTNTPYSQEFLAKQKEKLESELAVLQQQSDVRSEVEESQEINPEEAAGDVARQFTNQAESAVLDKKIEQIKKSIEQISSGHYGRCQNCGKWISEGRLEVMPTATRCANC